MIPQTNGGMPGIFPGQWGGEYRQQQPYQSPQHQPSHLNAIQMQQQMMMRHQQHHGGQSQIAMPGVIGGIAVSQLTGGQLMSYHGHSNVENPAAAQAQDAMIMNHQGMSNSLSHVPVSGGGLGTSVGGAMVLNGMQTASSFAGMQQQFQQQASHGALTQQGCQPHLGQMNPLICGNAGGRKGAGSGRCFNAQSHHHQQQDQLALYWNALQASSIGHHHHGQQESGQAQEHGMEAAPKLQSALIEMNSHRQQQVEVPLQLDQPESQQLGGGGETAQLQDPQTQLLLQQQKLIAQLQIQLQHQEQRGQQLPQPRSNPGSMSQDQLQYNAIQQSQQLGTISFSPSIGGGQSQHSSQLTSNNLNRLHFPPAIQELILGNGNASFGLQMVRQNNLERSMQAQQQQLRQMANISVNDSNMSGAINSQKSDKCHEVLGNNSQHSIIHQSSTSILNPLMEPMIPTDNHARAGSTKPSRGATSVPSRAPSRAPSAAGSAWGDDVSAAIQNQNWNQQVLLEAMARRVSVASTGTQLQGNATNAPASQAQAQDPQQKQQQLLMTHLVQQLLGKKGANSSASSARNLAFTMNSLGGDGPGGVTVSGGEPSGSATVGLRNKAELEQRVKYQVMQHSKQLQDQNQVIDVGDDAIVGENQQQSQAQHQLAQFQSHQAQQQHFHDQGLPNGVFVSGLAQGRSNKEAKINASESSPPASDDSTAASLPSEHLAFSWNVGNKASSLRRGSHGSLSQGSLSQGSLSQGSFGIVDPDPIADGFNTALGCAALIGSTAAGGEGTCGGKNGQQNFLDGHFAGGWQSNADLPDRRRINFHIIKVIERMRPDANRMSQNRLPLMAKKLEEHLYRSAHTKEEYVDLASLKRRLHLIAKGVGIAKSDEGDDDGEGGDDSSLGPKRDSTGSVISGQIGGGQASGVRVDLNVSNNQTLLSCRRSDNQHVQQFEQQQLILQSEIQRQVFLIQQQKQSDKQPTMTFTENNADEKNRSTGLTITVSSNSAGAAANTKPSKRSVDNTENAESRPSKIVKPYVHESKEGETADKSSRSLSESSGSTSYLPDDSQKASSDIVFDEVDSSLISSMPVPDIEQHLDSLMSSGQMTPRYIARKCLPLVKKLINHEHGWVFKDAVDPVELGIPDYFDIVKHPMDLTLVANKLEDGAYKDMASFELDIKLVFENAILFNGDDSDVGLMAKELLDILAAEINTTKGFKIEKEPQKRRGIACYLCGNHRRFFDPPALFCSSSCGMHKIRRNATYYTDRFKQNHWCERCYNTHLKESEPILLDDGRETMKSDLVKLKNDSTPEEAWVQCNQCHEWSHQICALFNGTQNSKLSSFTCPKCYIRSAALMPERMRGKKVKGASDLPHCNLSRSIEEGLSKTLIHAYEKVAMDRGCKLSQVEKAKELTVRVISSLEKKHKVREEVRPILLVSDLNVYDFTFFPRIGCDATPI
ncbi:hypothetical protein ACHAXA_006869 [Cyclostephanos tholiformis]|uniref:histone acetyltransferase n=1 Tax=Cyclostephanos tholiformis TaxID=382380 RepID=A0ABD3R1N2_9STRA